MVIRNLLAIDVSTADAVTIAKHAFESRDCLIQNTADDDVLVFDSLKATSVIVSGSGRIALVGTSTGTEIRIGLDVSTTTIGIVVGILSLIASIVFFGLPLLVFWLLYDQACVALTHEFDKTFDEISRRTN